MGQDRLTPLDASFLHLEDGSASHMHVACVMIFDGRSPPYDEFVRRVERRMHLVPRYRQKLASVPLGQGRPRWIDDPHFDSRYHLRATALPAPGSEYELQVLAGRVFSQPLNRSKPLWETWLVEGLRGGRFGVLSKTHHALVDGIAGLDILSVLFSPEEDERDPDQWQPRPPPGGVELLGEALLERATTPTELIRPARALLRRPRQVTRAALDTALGVGALAWAGLQPAPRTPYNRRVVGPDRRFVWVRGSLKEVKEVKNSLGGTVNDVIITVVARALRRHLIRRGEKVDGLTMKAFVPVSVRTEDQRGGTGNQVSGMVAPLPISSPTAAACLGQVSQAMAVLKESGQTVGAQALTELSGFAPPNILSQASRLVVRQRFVNLVITNVPGPQFPLFLGDRELLDIFPMVPLGSNMGLGVAIVSYNGTLNFGLVGDFDAMPDLEDLAGDVTEALREVAHAAGVPHEPDPGALRESDPGPGRESATAPSTNGNGHRRLDERERHVGSPPSRGPGGDEPRPAPAAGPRAVEPRPEPGPAPSGHVDPEVELVAESADQGAQEGAGAQVQVDLPWPGYDRMRAVDIAERLQAADPGLAGVVRLYEAAHRGRRRVMEATDRAMRS
jgi:WS/DGAT/MGAT family acyltransferase